MKTNAKSILLCLGIASQAFGAGPHLVSKPESTVWLVGDSTLHPFTCRTTEVKVSAVTNPQKIAETPGPAPFDAVLQPNALKTFDVVIPVTSLTSKESKLDKNMDKALKSESCPDISFHYLDSAIAKDTSSPDTFHATVHGTLTIACQDRPVTLETNLTDGHETLHVQGQYKLLMSDYGIKPPSLMLGAIKVKDPVTVHFDLLLSL